MAQGRRGKSQARRSGGDGLPGWAWLVMGVALTLLIVLAVPRLFSSGDEGFFRPTPNPDAQPEPVEDEAVVETDVLPAPAAAPGSPATDSPEAPARDFDFYTMLPGREVPLSDAELAASEQAERQAQADAQAGEAGAAPVPVPVEPVAPAAAPPSPVAEAPVGATPAAPAVPPPAEPADGARYLLQAGAFEASGQAEELKAKIAMLGLGARVESARIGERTVYRVRMGPYGTATELAEAKRRLASGGLTAMAIKVD